MTRISVLTGLDRLAAENCARLKHQRVALLCHPASVTCELEHITALCKRCNINVCRCFGPEHGIWGDVQDMIASDHSQDPVTGAPVVSLYGKTEASLELDPKDLSDIDVLVIDLQDVGARYYTFLYTAMSALRAAAESQTQVLVLDRPNPIAGVFEGGRQLSKFLSFVGRFPLPTRHGLTIGECLSYYVAKTDLKLDWSLLEVQSEAKVSYFDELNLPFVPPSPNMPTFDTALVYPGQCLIEGTNLSEGRGTTRPFEVCGASFIDPFEWVKALEKTPLLGVAFRPVYFQPTFHKFAKQTIGGVFLHVTDRSKFEPLRTSLHMLSTLHALYPKDLRWRTETYEFVDDRLAIDLLLGNDEGRRIIESDGDIDEYWRRQCADGAEFTREIAPYLKYER